MAQKFTFFISTCLFLYALNTNAQVTTDIKDAWIRAYANGTELKNPFTGGFNAPQWSKVDLNNDGVQDLFVFDRVATGYHSPRLTFINTGTTGSPDYIYAPEYESRFPDVANFMLLRDYDGDGIADIFCYTPQTITHSYGIRVMKGHYDSQQKIYFTMMKDPLYYAPFSGPHMPLIIQDGDLPAIDDMDGDGDLDILYFDPTGSYMQYYLNLSVEQGYHRDSLIFRIADDCWGRFQEPLLTNTLALSPRIDSCHGKAGWVPRHGGLGSAGASIAVMDMDNDGNKEVVLGDIGFGTLICGHNTPASGKDWITSQDTTFPSYSTPVNLTVFPSAYFIDIDNDGLTDMMVSPNTTDRAETYNVGWYYKNTGTNALPHYTLQQRDFMVNTMIDRGMAGHPALFDYNHDGLLDLVMGHYGFYQSNNSVTVALWLYENTGTATDPRFTLVDTDFGNLAAISNSTSTYDLCPTFGDLDGDGDMDMIVGKAGGGLYYCENTGGTGNASFNNPPILEYQHIDAGSNVQPQLVDVDRDGLLDLLIGGRQGPIQYYKNTGTATNPVFDSNINSQTGYALPTIPLFGNIIPRQIYFGMGDAYTRPMLVPHNGNASLFLSLKSGQIGRFYPVYDANGQINVNIPLIDTVFGNINVNYLASAVIADINGDSKLDYIVGTSRGGCRIYTEGVLGHSPLAVELVENEQPKPFQLFPNPASDLVRIEFEGDVTADQLVVLDLLGEPLLTLPFKGRAQDISLTGLPNGMYFVTACHNGKVVQNGKLIIQHP